MPSVTNPAPAHLGPLARVALAGRIWVEFVRARIVTREERLPAAVRRLGAGAHPPRYRIEARRLGSIVARVLRVGPWRARCLWTALVLYRLLRGQGDDAQLVIGLPLEPTDTDAHAWVEVDGDDVGPPPGRGRHEELARYS
jgi:Transglutaminase-like superfamily